VSAGEGRGATFTLRIPALFTAAAEVAAPVNGSPPTVGSSLDIVVVEDNDDIADVLAEWLAELGHGVRVARTGKRAVELVREQTPDLVICDLGLPDLDGVEVCRQVRRLPLEHQPVMVALTGWGREGDVRATREAGFEHHLVKPVATEKLQALLGKIGDSRQGEASAGARHAGEQRPSSPPS
jgi:CheY-like chemotaxis protein